MAKNMRILSVRIVGMGPLRDVFLDFRKQDGRPMDTILLAGANGTGKTTLLETIANLFHLVDQGGATWLMGKLERCIHAQVDILLQKDTQTDVIPISLFYGNKDEPQQNEVYGWSTKGSLKISRNMSEISNQIKRWTQESVNSGNRDLFPSLLYFPHFRVIKPSEGDTVHKETLLNRWVFTYEPASQFAGSLDSYLVWLEYARPAEFEETKRFLNEYALFRKKIKGVNREELKTVIKKDSGEEHWLENLSSGEQNIMVLLLEIKRRLIPGSIIMIDEIENSLHEAFQYKIGNILKKLQRDYDIQLIVTSHSETFLKIFGAENTVILPGE